MKCQFSLKKEKSCVLCTLCVVRLLQFCIVHPVQFCISIYLKKSAIVHLCVSVHCSMFVLYCLGQLQPFTFLFLRFTFCVHLCSFQFVSIFVLYFLSSSFLFLFFVFCFSPSLPYAYISHSIFFLKSVHFPLNFKILFPKFILCLQTFTIHYCSQLHYPHQLPSSILYNNNIPSHCFQTTTHITQHHLLIPIQYSCTFTTSPTKLQTTHLIHHQPFIPLAHNQHKPQQTTSAITFLQIHPANTKHTTPSSYTNNAVQPPYIHNYKLHQTILQLSCNQYSKLHRVVIQVALTKWLKRGSRVVVCDACFVG